MPSFILPEQWIVDGVSSDVRPPDESLYIRPLMNPELLNASGPIVQTLVLDNNVLSDLVQSRRPGNATYLENLLKRYPIELNPVVALLEQRQKYALASQALVDYAGYLERAFGHKIPSENVESFERTLNECRPEVLKNMETLAGYLPLTVFLYHQDWPVEKKLEAYAGIATANDLPIFQLHFYFAALMFLSRERPELFQQKDLDKIKEDMKKKQSVEAQWIRILNLANDLLFPAMSLFSGGLSQNTTMFAYAATRDRSSQLLLSEVVCQAVVYTADGRANGQWELAPGRLLDQYLGATVRRLLPRREAAERTREHAREVRQTHLRAFAQQYVERIVELATSTPPGPASGPAAA